MSLLLLYAIIITILFFRMWVKRDAAIQCLIDFTWMLHESKKIDKEEQKIWFIQYGYSGIYWRN